MSELPARPRTPSVALAVKKRLRHLGCETFFDYLKTPHWRAFRLRYKASDLPQECICGSLKVELHHLTYERLGRELLADVFPLCRKCHAMVHVFIRRGIIDVGIDPRVFRSDERAAMYGVDLRDAAERAAAEFAGRRAILLTDTASLRELTGAEGARLKALRRRRLIAEGRLTWRVRAPRRDIDHARPSDLRRRSYGPDS